MQNTGITNLKINLLSNNVNKRKNYENGEINRTI